MYNTNMQHHLPTYLVPHVYLCLSSPVCHHHYLTHLHSPSQLHVVFFALHILQHVHHLLLHRHPQLHLLFAYMGAGMGGKCMGGNAWVYAWVYAWE